MLNMNRLRMLREVAARGTIAAAAESLFMSPSAVSQQMAVLERETGVMLLERHGRGVRLTEAGQSLVEDTDRILAVMEETEAHLAQSTAGIVGHVRVSAFPTAARAILVPALVELEAAHPNLRVSMVDLEPEEAQPALKAGDLDLVLTYEWDALPVLADLGIAFDDLATERVYLVLAKDHPLALENRPISIAELKHEAWVVGRDQTSMLDIVTTATRRYGYEPRTDLHSMDFAVILAAVAAGLGVALVPPLAFWGEQADIAVRELSDLVVNRTIRAGIRRGSESNPRIDAIMRALHRAADALPSTLDVTASIEDEGQPAT